MFLNSLKIDNYKNLERFKLTFDKKINCFIGKNGIGKTNIVDSIYHLAFTKSYFNPSTSQNVMTGSDYFSLIGEFSISKRNEIVNCYYKIGDKKFINRNLNFYLKIFTRILIFLFFRGENKNNLFSLFLPICCEISENDSNIWNN